MMFPLEQQTFKPEGVLKSLNSNTFLCSWPKPFGRILTSSEYRGDRKADWKWCKTAKEAKSSKTTLKLPTTVK